MRPLLAFLARLRAHRIHHVLTQARDEALMVQIAVPGQRWEVEFFDDGHVEIERFLASPEGVVTDAGKLDDLLREFGDDDGAEAGAP